jgi:pimeloyl-ACP methyl ester carboxylesterase
MRRSVPYVPAAAAVVLSAMLLPAAAAARPADHLKPCHVEGVGAELLCGTYPVWEDRAAQRGRKIDLNVVVVPALDQTPAPDAILYLDGGPGAAATRDAAGFLEPDGIHRHRDVLLVDQRGTGKSNPLNCDFYGPDSHLKHADSRLLAGDLFPPDKVRACRDQLSKVADLRLYTTALAVDDFDEVRAWLGYDKVDLVGGSYGTRAAQVYLHRHPGSVRTMLLDGVLPMDELIPLHHAYAGKRAVDILFAECAADAACRAAFPHLAEELQAVFERVDRGVKVTVKDAHGDAYEVVPSRGLIAEGLRFLMYGSGARTVPLAVHRAYQGDLSQLVGIAVDRRASIDHLLSMGLNFSVTCAEDLPFIDDAAAARATAGTLLGDYRVREQKRVCADWPRGAVPADVHQPVVSDVPALLISGERDPVTPPEFGERVIKGLSHGRLVIVPHGSHGAEGPCADAVTTHFIERGTVEGLDTSCVTATPPTKFVTKEHVVARIDPGILDRYAGTYQLGTFQVVLAPRDGHLLARLAGQEDLDLFPESDHHFFAKSDDLEIDMVDGAGAGAPPEMVVHFGAQEMRGKRVP